jgi:dipeptidase D
MDILKEPVLRFFSEISRIPRGSGNEKAVSDYLVGFAKSRNLEVIQDKALNVIIKKPGTIGYENAPTVILQGHMDMVCDKNKNTVHDFEKDPIELRVEGDMLYAKGTTLGADNGIAVAYMLELLDSKDIPHPPIEALVTTSEETGMDGAAALNPNDLKGRYLINMDSEEEGKLLTSCAGGVNAKHMVPVIWEDVKPGLISYLISVKGLKGGHSGADIHLGRGNTVKLMGRLLHDAAHDIEIYISDINGGSKNNAIPREVDAIVSVDPKDRVRLEQRVSMWDQTFKKELRVSDPGVNVTIEGLKNTAKRMLSRDTARKALASMVLIPNGIQTMSMDIEGLVESSTNIGVVKTNDKDIVFESALRSSVKSLKYYIQYQSKTAAEILGAKFVVDSDYPEWEYNPDSKIRRIFEEIHERKYGRKPEVVAIHAGLECGLFKSKFPDMDMISFGPNLYDVHTPDEHMSLSSAERTWEYLLDVLKEIK